MNALLVSVLLAASAEVDPSLQTLIDAALAQRPELARAHSEVDAAQAQVARSTAWSDPMLLVGVQNDGFEKWEVGRQHTSWVQVMASQTVPFPGKKAAAEALAQSVVKQQEFVLERARRSTIADVRRAWSAMGIARARVALLDEQKKLLEQALSVATSRYEAGNGSQADVLRAKLEVSRLAPRRALLVAEGERQGLLLSRLSGVSPLPDPLPREGRGRELASFPQFVTGDSSPEVLSAQAAVETAQKNVTVQERVARPDVTVSAGLMLRGALDPMWTLSLGVPVPSFSVSQQTSALAEAQLRVSAAQQRVNELEQQVKLATAQRRTAWNALEQAWLATRDVVQADAQATVEATLTQYRNGMGSFAAVLDAARATVSLRDESLLYVAQAEQLVIAEAELALTSAPLTAPAATATSEGSM